MEDTSNTLDNRDTFRLLLTLDHISSLVRKRSLYSGLVLNRAENQLACDAICICFNRWKEQCSVFHANHEKRLEDDNRQLREKIDKLKGLLSKSHAINVKNQTTGDVAKKNRDDSDQNDSRDDADKNRLADIQAELSQHYESQIQLATKLASVRIQETVERATSSLRSQMELMMLEQAKLEDRNRDSSTAIASHQSTIAGLETQVSKSRSEILSMKHSDIIRQGTCEELESKLNQEKRMKLDLEAELLTMKVSSDQLRSGLEHDLRVEYESKLVSLSNSPQSNQSKPVKHIPDVGIAQLMRENDVLKRSCQELKAVLNVSDKKLVSSLDIVLIDAVQDITVSYQSAEEKSMASRTKYDLMSIHFRLSKAIHRAEALVEFVTWKLVPFVGKGLEKLVIERDRGTMSPNTIPKSDNNDDDDDECAIYALAVLELGSEVSRLEEELEGMKIERSPWRVDSPAATLEPGRVLDLPLPIRYEDTELSWKFSVESAKADISIVDNISVSLIQYPGNDFVSTVTQPSFSTISSDPANGDSQNTAPLIQLLQSTNDNEDKSAKCGRIIVPIPGMATLRFTNTNRRQSVNLSSKVACVPPDDPKSDMLLNRLEVVEAAKSRLEMALYGAEVISNHVISWYCKWRQCRLSVKQHSVAYASCHRQLMTVAQHKIKLQCEVELDRKCIQASGKTIKQLRASSCPTDINHSNSISALISNKLTYNSTDLIISPGKDFRVTTNPMRSGDSFQWTFSITSPGLSEAPGLDIGFSICRENDKLFDQVVAYTRLKAPSACPVCGTFIVSVEGVYVFVWDNTYSWLNPKSLTYKIETRISKPHDVRLKLGDDDDDDVQLPSIMGSEEIDKRQTEIDKLNDAMNELCDIIARQKDLLEMSANELESLAPYALGLCNEVTEFIRTFSDLPSKSL